MEHDQVVGLFEVSSVSGHEWIDGNNVSFALSNGFDPSLRAQILHTWYLLQGQ